MEYPEEIYATRDGGMLIPKLRSSTSSVGWGRQHAHRLGYEAGKAEQPDHLAGYSNLTVAIKDNEPIDWERLDGLNAKCINPGVGIVSGKLKRRESAESDSPNGWWKSGMDYIWVNALTLAWNDEDGWTLWVEGEIPLIRKTADQLEVGTYFRGELPGYMEGEAYVGGEEFGIGKRVHRSPSMIESTVPASEWVVIEEYGPFQKPEDK